MHILGGMVINITESLKNKTFSTFNKGESLHDSITVVDNYMDIIVVKSPVKVAAEIADNVDHHSVINAGDGVGQYINQVLLDVYTILKEKGNL